MSESEASTVNARGVNTSTPWFETSWEVLYYETDRMGIVHHSNYIRWFEYGRVHYLRAIGAAYEELEADGIESPVVQVEAQYRKPAVFGDVVTVKIRCIRYTGVRIIFEYRVEDQEGQLICEGKSEHAFALQETHRVISLSHHRPALHERLLDLIRGRALWKDADPDATAHSD